MIEVNPLRNVGIGLSTIRGIMKKGVDTRVSTLCLVYVKNVVEDFIIQTTIRAKTRLEEINRFRRTQGLKELRTVTEDIFREVLDESYKNT